MDVDVVSSFSAADLRRFRRTVAARCAQQLNAHDREDVAASILLETVRTARSTGLPVRALAILGSRRVRHYERAATRAAVTAGELAPTDEGSALTTNDPFLRVELNDLVRRLPFEQRTALVLCEVEGLTLTEAADVIGVATSTMHDRLTRARAALARAWREAERA